MPTSSRPEARRRILPRRRPSVLTIAAGLCVAGASAAWVTALAAPMLTPTQAALHSSLNPSVQGQAVTLVATIGGGGSSPTGSVDFKDGSALLATRPISNGRSSLTTTTLAVGNHPITVVYGGDSTYAGSTSPVLTQTVATAGTTASTTTLTSSANPAATGQPVSLVATVAGTGKTPTGTVSFRDGDATLSVRPLSGGRASLITSSLTAGSHSLTAVYGGDPTFAGSTSTALTQTVTAPGSTASKTALLSSVNPGRAGQPITFTATVTGASATPTGSVTFKDGTTVLAVRPLSGGRSTLTIRTLTVGSHSITAAYSGNSTFAPSTSAPLSESVGAGSSPATAQAGPGSSQARPTNGGPPQARPTNGAPPQARPTNGAPPQARPTNGAPPAQ